MIFKQTKLSLLLITLLTTSPAYSMLVKQVKKDSSAHLYLIERRKKDLLIPKQEDREVFDTIITVGKVAVQHAGAVTQNVQSAIILIGASILHKLFTGEYPIDRWHRNQKKEQKRLDEICKVKSDPNNLDPEDLNYMENENFPKNYDGMYSYKIEKNNNYVRGYRFVPNHNVERNIGIIPVEKIPKGCFIKSEDELPAIPCFPEPEKEAPSTDCFPKPCETEVPSQGCFTEDVKNELPTGCSNENIQNEVQPRGCFDEVQLPKTPLTLHYEGQIRVGDVYFPEIPRREDGFRPEKVKGNKIEKKYNQKTKQWGYVDKRGYWWIPCGKNDSGHGGEHWELLNRWNEKVDNIYPGGTTRDKVKSPHVVFCSPLPSGNIKAADYENNPADKAGPGELIQKIDISSQTHEAGEIIISPETSLSVEQSFEERGLTKVESNLIKQENIFKQENVATIKMENATVKQDEQKSSTVDTSSLPEISIPQQVAYVTTQEPNVTYGPSPARRLFNALRESYNSGTIGRLLAISSLSDSLHRTSTSLSWEERMSDPRSRPVFNNPDSANYSPFKPCSSAQFPFHGGQRTEHP